MNIRAGRPTALDLRSDVDNLYQQRDEQLRNQPSQSSTSQSHDPRGTSIGIEDNSPRIRPVQNRPQTPPAKKNNLYGYGPSSNNSNESLSIEKEIFNIELSQY